MTPELAFNAEGGSYTVDGSTDKGEILKKWLTKKIMGENVIVAAIDHDNRSVSVFEINDELLSIRHSYHFSNLGGSKINFGSGTKIEEELKSLGFAVSESTIS